MLKGLVQFFVRHRGELFAQTYQHVVLTLVALLAAVSIGLAVGLWLSRHRRFSGFVLGLTGIIQTIPSLALLGFLIPLMGIGAPPAILALFLYALLPIVRNAYTGIQEVDPAVREAAAAMGMTDAQILLKVELPLALPVIFAGIRTATVINIGIATLCALIGAGGLGAYIFRGISLNDTTMIVAGALPAAALALAFDGILASVQKRLDRLLRPLLWLVASFLAVATVAHYGAGLPSRVHFRLAIPPEFMERADGYRGFVDRYGFAPEPVEIDHGLMYRALHEGKADGVIGYSTDGEIATFDLVVLEDDRHYFPPYQVAPLIRESTLRLHPEVEAALDRLGGLLDDAHMAALNARVDQRHVPASIVAREFLQEQGIEPRPPRREGVPDIVIGSKIFAEQYILAEMFAQVIESTTLLTVELKTGLGGTKICFEALRKGEIDLYPEYTGTGLLAILEVPAQTREGLLENGGKVYDYVRRTFHERFDLLWLEPLGFDNSYALIVERRRADRFGVHTVSALVERLRHGD